MLKRLFALIVMIFSVIGAILCVAGILGAWIAPIPIKAVANGALDTVNGYAVLAGQSTQNASERIAGVRTDIEDAQQRVQDATPEQREAVRQQVRTAIQEKFGPSVTAVRNTAASISAGLGTLNKSLEGFNRIPGVNVPTLTDELEAVNQRMDTVNGRLDNFKATMSDKEYDGSKLNAAVTQVTDELKGLEAKLGEWQTKLGNVSTSVENAKNAIASALTTMSIASTLFFALFGAGQISLFSHALGWFRKPRAA